MEKDYDVQIVLINHSDHTPLHNLIVLGGIKINVNLCFISLLAMFPDDLDENVENNSDNSDNEELDEIVGDNDSIDYNSDCG